MKKMISVLGFFILTLVFLEIKAQIEVVTPSSRASGTTTVQTEAALEERENPVVRGLADPVIIDASRLSDPVDIEIQVTRRGRRNNFLTSRTSKLSVIALGQGNTVNLHDIVNHFGLHPGLRLRDVIRINSVTPKATVSISGDTSAVTNTVNAFIPIEITGEQIERGGQIELQNIPPNQCCRAIKTGVLQ